MENKKFYLFVMKSIVESINQGQLDRNFGTLSFSTGIVEHTIHAGDICEGSFSVLALDHNLCEGTVLSDDYRMQVINEEFTGIQDEIAYRFDSKEISEGQDIKGNFIIISNRGEYLLPFLIHIEAYTIESSLGPIRNMFHFTNLAKANWNEALSVFYNPLFKNIFRESDREFLPIYKALSGILSSEINMDEFLISIRKKTPVEYIASESEISIDDPVGISRYSLGISRNGWGYTHLQIEVEGDFLEVDKSDIGPEDFLGNNYLAYYYVNSDKLHAGKNMGSIILRDRRLSVRIPVMVRKESESKLFREMSINRMKGIVQIMEYYQSFRFKKISARIWIAESTKVIEKMLASDPEDLVARLYQIHIMLTQERFNEANWNLKSVKASADSVRDSQPYLWCYYLYLCSLSDMYIDQIDDFTAEVEFCFKQNQNDWRIAWLMSYMSDEYKNAVRKWVMFEQTFENGCTSPIMYMEAARLVLDNPALLNKLDSFEIQVLRSIYKKGLMTEEIVFVLKNLAERMKEYSETVTGLLMNCYREFPQEELLMVICAQMIKGNRTDKIANKWYGYAVSAGLKIIRLFEYYMLSVEQVDGAVIPKPVLLYFSFHSDLDYETNAFLYSCVISNRDSDPEMYSRYKNQIVDYVLDQLRAGNNSKYLSRVYRHVIDDEMITDDEIARLIADILFIHEVDVSKYPEAKALILCYGHHDKEYIYPITKGVVEVPIFSEDYCLALEDEKHRRFVLSKPVETIELMPPGRLMLNIQLMLQGHIGMDAHCCMEHHMSFDIRQENEFRFRNLLEHDYFSSDYQRMITMKLVRFYYDQDRVEDLDRFLDALSADSILPYERVECIRYLVKRKQYAKALNWIYRFGPEGVDKSIITELVYGWIPAHRDEENEYESLLLQILYMTLPSVKTNIICMQYLSERAKGQIRILRDIWLAVRETGIEVRDLEERIILQFLMTGAYIQERCEILKDYALSIPDGDILRAALAEESYEYFSHNGLVSDDFFYVLTEAFDTDIELNIVCSLAYVKFFSENKELIDDKVAPTLKSTLHMLLNEEIILACYKDLSDFMPSMAQYAEAEIIEYRTSQGAHVAINYVIESDVDNEYTVEDMKEVFNGVFIKVFNIFFGEKLMYYITEQTEEEGEILSESRTLIRNDIDDTVTIGKFGMINDICVAKTLHDYATVDALLEELYKREFTTNKLFGMHKG